jgi:hypothetical protein
MPYLASAMRTVVVFTVVYTVALLSYGLAVDSPLTLLYTGINIGLFLLFGVLHIWARWPLYALWAVSLVGLGNMIGGVFLVDGDPLYISGAIGPVPFDKFFHALAAFGLVAIAWEASKRWSGSGYHLGGMLILTFLVVMGGGAVVEIAELIGASVSDVSVGDYGNNALDLVANAVGAALGVALVLWNEMRRAV